MEEEEEEEDEDDDEEDQVSCRQCLDRIWKLLCDYSSEQARHLSAAPCGGRCSCLVLG